jgi:methionine synthase I (cobalamin-dependent)
MKNLPKSLLLATALFVSTSSFASDDFKEKKYQQQKQNKDCKYHGYKNKHKHEGRSHRGDVSRFVIGAVYNLKLTTEQETQIDKTIQEFKNKKFDRFNGFTKDGFDKQAYVNARVKSKEEKIKLKADLIEKIYTILDKNQIEQINKQIVRFKEMKKKRGKNGSSCHDRR